MKRLPYLMVPARLYRQRVLPGRANHGSGRREDDNQRRRACQEMRATQQRAV